MQVSRAHRVFTRAGTPVRDSRTDDSCTISREVRVLADAIVIQEYCRPFPVDGDAATGSSGALQSDPPKELICILGEVGLGSPFDKSNHIKRKTITIPPRHTGTPLSIRGRKKERDSEDETREDLARAESCKVVRVHYCFKQSTAVCSGMGGQGRVFGYHFEFLRGWRCLMCLNRWGRGFDT